MNCLYSDDLISLIWDYFISSLPDIPCPPCQRFSAHLTSVDLPDLGDNLRETASRVETAIGRDRAPAPLSGSPSLPASTSLLPLAEQEREQEGEESRK